MITDAFITGALAALDWLLGFLPEVDISQECGQLSTYANYAAWLGRYVDITSLIGLAWGVIVVEGALALFHALEWLYEKIPFI